MEAASAHPRLAIRPVEATIGASDVAGALLAALGYRALVLSRQTNAIHEEASQ